jgi:hypothetical protein
VKSRDYANQSAFDVTVTPLDSLFSADEMKRPAMLKIDVQGFEMEALRGCEPLLENFDWIYAECSFVDLNSGQKLASDVIQWLGERDFIISGIYNPCFADDGQSVQADFTIFSQSQRQVTTSVLPKSVAIGPALTIVLVRQ